MSKCWIASAAFVLAGCASAPSAQQSIAASPAAPVEVQILAINDFHGNLEPPKLSIDAGTAEAPLRVPAGGVAYLASAAQSLRAERRYSLTVSAGDMIGGSPFVSALFLDEPTIMAMHLVGVEYNAVGNHEFDRGSAELVRMQRGGCEKHATKQPCRLEPFPGAKFQFLAANVLTSDGRTLFPATAIKDFGPVQVGIIGMTLKETATLVTPAGVAGLTFADEAATANAAVPVLKDAGADAIVLLIHQGGRTKGGYNDKSCPELSGDILPVIERLDSAIDLVISGHTHTAYICELPRSNGRPRLLTSAGRFGTLISDIRLTFAPDGTLTGQRADNVIVQGEGYTWGTNQVPVVRAFRQFPPHGPTKALVDRYAAAAAPEASRVVGKLADPVTKSENEDREQSAGNFIADAQLAASRNLGAQVAFINSGGVRTDLVPVADGSITYGQIFAMQPFGNNLVVVTLTGAQLKALLEQQFQGGSNSPQNPTMLLPSKGFFFAYDLSRPAGQRIVEMRLGGRAIDPDGRYRVTVNNFLASGGDNFTVLKEGREPADAGLDLDALEAFLKSGAAVPELGRIDDRTPKPQS